MFIFLFWLPWQQKFEINLEFGQQEIFWLILRMDVVC